MLVYFVTLGLTLAAGADKPAGDAEKVVAALAGHWEVTSSERGGVKAKDRDYTRLVFSGDKLTVTRAPRPNTPQGAEEQHDARCRVDPTAKTIEAKFITGPDQEKTFYGVYELSGDTLKVCWGENKDKRPTELASKKGSDAVLLILRRSKP